MPYTTADLERVRAAMTRGELRVQFADRAVQYRSIEELERVETRILQELNPGRPRQSFGVASKGFDSSE